MQLSPIVCNRPRTYDFRPLEISNTKSEFVTRLEFIIGECLLISELLVWVAWFNGQ